jgi:uncharacterized protein (DUF736 family)
MGLMSALWDAMTGRAAAQMQEQLREAQAAQDQLRDRLDRQGRLLTHVRSQLRESTTTDTERKLARSGAWDPLGGASANLTDIVNGRLGYLERWTDKAGRKRRFSTSRRAIDLHADFCFGGGLEAPVTGDENLDEFLSNWWHSPQNQASAFSMTAQKRMSASLLIDGCVLLACHGVGKPRMQVRPMDRLQFRQVVTHPDDASRVLYYERRWTPAKFERGEYRPDGRERVLYYTDAANDPSDPDYDDPYREELAERNAIALDKSGQPVLMVRGCASSLSVQDWGVPVMPSLMDWELMMIEAAEDQSTMSRASASLAIMMTLEGDSSDVAAAEAYYGQSTTTPGVGVSNPGDINVLNQAASLKMSRAATGAYETARNVRVFLQYLSVGAGWAPHFLGDSENANLATTKSMELPIIKYCLGYQALWVSLYTALSTLALRGARNAEGAKLVVPVPKLLIEDLMDLVEAIQAGAAEEWATEEQSTREYWSAMGAPDVAAEVEKALQAAEERKAEEAKRPPPTIPWPPERQTQPQGQEEQTQPAGQAAEE